MGPREVVDKITTGVLEHEDLTRTIDCIVWPHDTDHLGLALMPANVVEQGLFTRA